ncbi:hypothetical protein, partial [Rhodococcus gordoniae]
KYKLRNSRAATPGRDDQYQMFAYSHLVADEERRPGRVMLIYPELGRKHDGIEDPTARSHSMPTASRSPSPLMYAPMSPLLNIS